MRRFNVVLSVFFAFVLLLVPFAYYALSNSYHEKVLFRLGVLQSQENDVALDNVASYLDGSSELDQNIFSEREILHMADVKLLLDILRYLLMLVLTIFIVLTVFEAMSVNILSIAWTALVGAGVAFVASLLKLLFWGLAFRPLFVLFHKIFFMNDFWVLGGTSKLILLFPEQFFKSIVISSILTTILLSLFVAAISGTFLYHSHVQDKKSWGKLWRVY